MRAEADALCICVCLSLGGFSSPGSWSHLPVIWPPPKELLKVILSVLCPVGDKRRAEENSRTWVADIHTTSWTVEAQFSHPENGANHGPNSLGSVSGWKGCMQGRFRVPGVQSECLLWFTLLGIVRGTWRLQCLCPLWEFPIHRLLLPLKSCPAIYGLASPLPMETQTFPMSVPSGHNAS